MPLLNYLLMMILGLVPEMISRSEPGTEHVACSSACVISCYSHSQYHSHIFATVNVFWRYSLWNCFGNGCVCSRCLVNTNSVELGSVCVCAVFGELL